MLFPLSRQSADCSILFVFLLIFFLTGCRSPEQPTEKKEADHPTVQTAAEPLSVSAPPIAPQPLPVPAPPADNVQTANPVVGQEEGGAPPNRPPRPLVAIIIDDMGYNRQLGYQFLQFGANLSFSFLPQAPFTAELVEEAFHGGHDVLVHLPMEPNDEKLRLEPTALLVKDSPERIRQKTEAMLAAIPHAIGANNHMGSRFSESGPGMRVVIETLKARSLFFVDSYTSGASRGLKIARQLHLPFTRRHLFLDNVQDAAAICRQIDLLVNLAYRQGQAVGIGHPNQAMFAALSQCGDDSFQGIEMVGVHRLMH
ncbi:divergent polysaccharide deacetylase family protein [uncultured Desulfobulbus sp.]|uniref:divergent polysaccharide deacetylase family protein n=1 Tax=uncultured Desulfobulbus sp. TaxID=239745 RepID=UPI0029C6F4C7|nr:divergent polysaccharide deacetylase family protein [uncultured Desulfobulbus sp.]